MSKKITFSSLLCLFITFLNAQNWTNYTVANTSKTLISDFTNDIDIDSKGNKWIASSSGLTKFDGVKYTHYTKADGLLDNNVRTVEVNKKNDNVWIGTSYGVQVFDGSKWTKYTTKEGLVYDNISTIAFDALNNACIGTYAGVSVQSGTTWKNYNKKTNTNLKSEWILSIAFDDKNNMWIGTSGGGVASFNGTAFTVYTKTDGLNDDDGNSLFFDSKKRLWVGCSYGLTTLVNGKWVNDFLTSGAKQIREDADGIIWIVTSSRLYKFTDVGKSTFLDNNGAISFARSLVLDKNTKWIGTENGVYTFDNAAWKLTKVTGGLTSDDVRSVKIDANGKVYLGTKVNISLITNNKWSEVNEKEVGVSYLEVSDLLIDNNNVWFTNEKTGTILKYDGAKYFIYETKDIPEIPNAWVNRIFKDKKGNMWFGFDSGVIVKFDGTKWSSITLPNSNFFTRIYCLGEDKTGNLWVGTSNYAYKYDGTTITSYGKNEGIGSSYVNAVFLDSKGNFWLSAGSTYQFNGTKFIEVPNTPSNINAMAEDSKGNLWFATAGASYYVSKFDGVKWSEINFSSTSLIYPSVKSIAFDKKNNVWFASDKGVFIYGEKQSVPVEDEVVSNQKITVFPNPTTQELTILTNDSITQNDIEVLNINGQRMALRFLQDNKIDVSEYPKGIYFVKVKAIKGIYNSQFVKM